MVSSLTVPVALAQDNDFDGKIVLTFLDNNNEVRGDFYPPLEDGVQISPGYILELLEKNNIVYGINHDEIHKAYTECTEHQMIVRDVLIAQGIRPIDEIPAYLQLNPHLGMKNAKEGENGAVDHRTRSPFIIVRKDQALAKLKRHKPGQNGTNVHGEIANYQIAKVEEYVAGENTRMEDRYLLANVNGQMSIIKKTINVSNKLQIKGAIGYTTGNIIFPGDVEIEGPVSDGFKIYSGGSVTIKQTFDVTDAITKNDLNVAGGIIGRGQALVKVGGCLRTKFIENCRVACRKTVTVDMEIMNSKIYTLEMLEMGERGKIVGGEIYALKGLRTSTIGKKTGKAARIHCGIDFTAEQEKEKQNNILKILAAKLGSLRELMTDPNLGEEKRAKMQAFLEKLEEEQLKAQARVSELLGKINSYDKAVVEVKGDIVQGTLIEICQIALFVQEPLRKVRIRLDRTANKLITENL